MNLLFGKGPEHNNSTKEISHIDKLKQQEGIDSKLQQRFHRVIEHIRAGVDTHTFGHILSQTDNSVMHTKISKIEFRNSKDGRMCVITFNDRPEEDDFTIEADIDNNPESANDIYNVKILADGWIVVEQWHSDEATLYHFDGVSHDDIIKLIWFVERCMDLEKWDETNQ